MTDKKINFMKWIFEKKDVDGLIVAFLISASCNAFIKDFTKALVDPLIEGILPKTSENTEQILNINDKIIFKFKLQYLLSGFIRLIITFYLAYIIVKYLYQLFSLN